MNPNISGLDLSENKQTSLRSTNIPLVILGAFFVGLRFLSRWKRAYTSIDDYFIVLSHVSFLFIARRKTGG
jgi:hypothetical protein